MAQSHIPKFIIAKSETVYGTDAAPSGAANSILIRDDPVFKPAALSYVERNNAKNWLGHDQQLIAKEWMEIEFSVEMAGSGAAGTAPKFGPLLKSCAMSETLTASTKADYDPVTTVTDSATIWFQYSGKVHKMVGCRGSVSIEMSANQIPYLKFKFLGIKAAVPIADGALSGVTYAGWTQPVVVNKVNTPAPSVHGVSTLALYDFKLDVAGQLVYRDLPNANDVLINQRQPAGSVTLEDPLIATKDYWAAIRAATLSAITITHGTVAGNIVIVSVPNAQLTEPQYGNQDNLATLAMNVRALPGNTGNADFKLTFQ